MPLPRFPQDTTPTTIQPRSDAVPMAAEAAPSSRHLARLARVLVHVHDHLDEDLDLDRLADLAAYSPFHWHRIWHATFGETLAATVRRLRLHRASGLLASSQLSVERIAGQCGYDNAESFVRAFRGAYGQTPLAWRAAGMASVPGVLSVTIREMPMIALAGLDHQGSYMAIGRAFELAFLRLQQAGLMQPQTAWVAEYLDDPFAVPEARLRSRAGLSLPDGSDAPAPLVRFEVGGGPCAVLRYRGPYAEMRPAYGWLYGDWLLQSVVSPRTARSSRST